MTERPHLPYPSQFREESIALMRAHGGPALRCLFGRRSLHLGLAWMAACAIGDDARLPIDGGGMRLIDNDKGDSQLADVLAGWGTVKDASVVDGLRMQLLVPGVVWIASPVALYIVAPYLQSPGRIEWTHLSVRELDTGRLCARLELCDKRSDRKVEAHLAFEGAANLRAIASLYGMRPPGPEGSDA